MTKLNIFASSLLSFATILLSVNSVQAVNTPDFIRDPSIARPSSTPVTGSCQALQESIRRRSANMLRMANNMLTRFNLSFLEIQAFYTNRVLPTGRSVANYQALTAEVLAKKALVQSSLTTAETDLASFNCLSGDPRAQILKFNGDMRAVQNALTDFRGAIQNLNRAVRSVVSDFFPERTPGPERTGMPTRTQRPTFTPRPILTPRPTGTARPIFTIRPRGTFDTIRTFRPGL
jgi:hypothetical protein